MTVRTIEVKVDETLHNRAPKPGTEEITWAALDTAWNLLRDAAVRLVLQDMREQAAEQGIDFPATDEELFQEARDSGDPDAPTSHLDLAPENELAAMGLHSVLQLLAQDAAKDASQGLQDARDIESL
jgi:hypothetical protein